MLRFLVFACCFVSFQSFASEYNVSLLGVAVTDVKCGVTAINDKGQVLGLYQETRQYSISKVYIYDSKNGLTLIEAKDQNLSPIAINNAGQVLGYGNKPFIWSKAFGIRWLEVPNSTQTNAIDLNDLGQIIGSYLEAGSVVFRPFMWDYGVVTDMGPNSEFSQSIEVLGYHVMSIQLLSLNNRGELAGTFSYGKFNKKTNKYIAVGSENFFWDGDIHILPKPEEYLGIIKVNNHGVVLLYNYNKTTYLWDKQSGFRIIDNFIGRNLNDSNTVFGETMQFEARYNQEFPKPSVWNDGITKSLATLLGVKDISNIAPRCSDDYLIESLDFSDGCNRFDINNKGQIPCMGQIWGDQYPCLLEPINPENIGFDLSLIKDPGVASNDGNRSLLQSASRMGLVEACQMLIDSGQDPNSKDKWGNSCLHLAADLNINAQNPEEKKTL